MGDSFRGFDIQLIITVLAASFTIVGSLASAFGKASQVGDLIRWLRNRSADAELPEPMSPLDGVMERLAEAREVLRQQYNLAKAHRVGGGSLTFGQFIVGGLLASSFVQDHTSKTLVGLLGLLVLASSIIRQHYKPESSSIAARERAVTLKAVIRYVEDQLYFNRQGLDQAVSPWHLRGILTQALNELDMAEAQALARAGTSTVAQRPKELESEKP